jgi:hypothetical protein
MQVLSVEYNLINKFYVQVNKAYSYNNKISVVNEVRLMLERVIAQRMEWRIQYSA